MVGKKSSLSFFTSKLISYSSGMVSHYSHLLNIYSILCPLVGVECSAAAAAAAAAKQQPGIGSIILCGYIFIASEFALLVVVQLAYQRQLFFQSRNHPLGSPGSSGL